jgi:hypothetical protein
MPELAGDVIGKAGRAHFGNGKPACGHDEPLCAGRAAAGLDREPSIRMGHAGNFCGEADLRVALVAFVQQHLDDGAGFLVTEKLALVLFGIGQAVGGHEGNEIPGRVAGQRRFREMRVLAEKAVGARFEIGEVAASAAGDAYLVGGAFCMV